MNDQHKKDKRTFKEADRHAADYLKKQEDEDADHFIDIMKRKKGAEAGR